MSVKDNQDALEELTDQLEAVLDDADDEAEEAKSEDVEVAESDESEEKGESRRVVMVPVTMNDDDEMEKEGHSDDYMDDEEMEKEGMMSREQMMARRRALMEELEALEAEMSDEDMEKGTRSSADEGAMPSAPVTSAREEMEDSGDGDGSLELSKEEAELIMTRRSRMQQLGMEKDAIDEAIENEAIFCGVERKVLSGKEPCAFCVGGCAPEGDLPGLMDIEARATSSFKGDVVGSGYAPDDDMFVVDVKQENGDIVEAFYRGDGADFGWLRIDGAVAEAATIEGKAALEGQKVITMAEAEDVALKEFDGSALGVDAAIFEGYDAWAVQVEGVNGKSYDAYVGLDGTLLGYDEYDGGLASDLTEEEVAEIKSLQAELELKRAFSRERREQLAESGEALPDGSFPIVTVEDLKNAIQAYGRAGDKEKAQAHIMKRANELDREDLIPEEWLEKSDGESDETKSDTDTVETTDEVTEETEEKDDSEISDEDILKALADLEAIQIELEANE